MRLEKVQDALNKKNIKFEYTEEDGCGSLDFMFRGLKFAEKKGVQAVFITEDYELHYTNGFQDEIKVTDVES